MKFNKVLIPLAVFGLLAVSGFVLVGRVNADDDFGYGQGGAIQRLSERFNLDEDEVEETIDQYRQERRSERQADREERLSQAVEDGVITEDQKNMLVQKHVEMIQNRSQHRAEIQNWMEENGIDFDALQEYGCMGPMGGRGGFGRGKMGM